MPRFFYTLLAMSLGGSLMALLLLGLKMLLGRKLPSTAYYYLWLLVLLRFVIPLPGLIPVQERAESGFVMEYMEQSPGRIYQEIFTPGGYGEYRGTYPAADNADLSPAAPDLTGAVESREKAPSLFEKISLWQLLAFVYAAGAVIRFAAYILSYLRFSEALRRTLSPAERFERKVYNFHAPKKKPELMRSDAVRTPMLLGLFAPVLVLPGQGFSAEELNNIYRHELMHYRRGDMLYKWFSVLVYSLQWFNPLCILIRRELNRACELSCDEMLIAPMNKFERRSYGNTLLSLASGGALPAGVIATTFATEKRDLKERLEQIMKHNNKKLGRTLALMLALVLLVGCGAVLGPGRAEAENTRSGDDYVLVTPENGGGEYDKPIRVSTVDELLAAIGPNRQIWLEPGVYELDKAASYGGEGGEYYRWNECFDGWELVIENVENMELGVASEGKVEITALARYANVLRFEGCRNIMINGLTLGHDEEPGSCVGGVVYLSNCDYVHINRSALYGCGIIGVQAENCSKVFVTESEIYDCSISAVTAYYSYDVRVSDCKIYDCDAAWGGGIFEVAGSTGFAVVNCDITDNVTTSLITSGYSQQTVFLGNKVDNCSFADTMFISDGYPVTVDGCEFGETVFMDSYCASFEQGEDHNRPRNLENRELSRKDILDMERRDIPYEGPKQAEKVEIDESVNEDGMRQVKVKTVDEFLTAIGPNTMIELDGEVFDLSTAADYGSYGAQYYYWNNQYDGPELVITGVVNMIIVGEGVTISAIPRYANVLSFINCRDIELLGFTAGHTEEPGVCAGGVLNFQNCSDVNISGCHLFGCGILGIAAQGCENFFVSQTEIYECNQGALWLGSVENFVFENCDIHDCYKPEITLHDVRGVSYNGEVLINGAYYFENGALIEFDWEKFYG